MGNLFKRDDKKAQEQEPVNQPEGIELSEQELEQMSGGIDGGVTKDPNRATGVIHGPKKRRMRSGHRGETAI